MKKCYALLSALVVGVVLSACGDDSKSSDGVQNESVFKEVHSIDDLGNCNKNKFGEIIYVAETDSLYECGGNGWAPVDSSEVEGLLSGSSSSGTDASNGAKSSSSLKGDSSEVAKVEVVKVDSVLLRGFAQKGPFASGSSVTVYGLDSALKATKTKFSGKVEGDSGAFKVEKIVLPSQFALVQVTGFYTNENTGKKTSGTKTTLNAIVDLSEGKSVTANVNILTELEYARVKRLVEKEKFNVPAAKKRATSELLAIFGMDKVVELAETTELTSSDICLSDTNAAGKALLSASVLLQGDLSVGKFSHRLDDVAELFAETGSLDSAELRADLADWASRADSADHFESIRGNVKALNLSPTVPDFAPFLYEFWTREYSLGECTDSLEETIRKNTNKNSDYYGVGFACTSKRWHKSSALDTDLGLCTAKREGAFEERKREEKESEYYVCRTGTWQQIDEVTYELKLCTEERRQELATTEKSVSYVCEWDGNEGHWRKATDVEEEIGMCNSAKEKNIEKRGDNDIWACENNSWRPATEVEYRYGICTDSMKGHSSDTGDSVAMLPYYPPDSSFLILTEKNIEFFRCHEGTWENVSYTVSQYGDCSADKEGEMHEGIPKDSTFELGGYTFYHSLRGFVMCQNGSWVEISETYFHTKKECSAANDSTLLNGYACVHDGSGYYWRKQDDGERANGTFCRAALDDGAVHKGYVCEKKDGTYAWRTATTAEKKTEKVCGRKSSSYTVDHGYACEYTDSKYQWRIATDAEMATGEMCMSESATRIKNGYVCEFRSSAWRKANEVELETDTVCGFALSSISFEEYRGASTESEDHLFAGKYFCSKEGRGCLTEKKDGYCWRKASSSEVLVGQMCRKSNYRHFAWVENYMYRCTDSTDHVWKSWTYQTITDSRDKKAYRIVDIGDTVIMVDNLKYVNGGVTAKNCYQNYLNDCSTYGVLYTWTDAMGIDSSYLDKYYGNDDGKYYQGICMDGWHVPNRYEAKWLNDLSPSWEARGLTSAVGSYNSSESGFEKTAYWWSRYSGFIYQAYAYNNGGGGTMFKRDRYYLRCIKN